MEEEKLVVESSEKKKKFSILDILTKDSNEKQEDKKEKKEHKKILRIKKWFGNDDDGLTITDTLTVCIFIFWVLTKSGHILISIIKSTDINIMTQLNVVISSIDSIMTTMAMFYFGTNAIHYTMNKVHDMNVNKYETQSSISRNELEAKIIETNITANNTNQPTYVPQDPNISEISPTEFIPVDSDNNSNQITEQPIIVEEKSDLFY